MRAKLYQNIVQFHVVSENSCVKRRGKQFSVCSKYIICLHCRRVHHSPLPTRCQMMAPLLYCTYIMERYNATASEVTTEGGIEMRLLLLLLLLIATATWLGGWVAGWLSHSGIVSKRLNLSENFFDHLKAPSF